MIWVVVVLLADDSCCVWKCRLVVGRRRNAIPVVVRLALVVVVWQLLVAVRVAWMVMILDRHCRVVPFLVVVVVVVVSTVVVVVVAAVSCLVSIWHRNPNVRLFQRPCASIPEWKRATGLGLGAGLWRGLVRLVVPPDTGVAWDRAVVQSSCGGCPVGRWTTPEGEVVPVPANLVLDRYFD